MLGRIAALALLSGLATPTQALADESGILGRWSPMDGAAVINIAPCAARSAKLCGVVEEEKLAPGEPSQLGQVVVRDLAPAGPGRWRGRYFEDGASYGATVNLLTSREVEFRVCVMPLLCQTERYQRAGG